MKNTLLLILSVVFAGGLFSCSNENSPSVLKDLSQKSPEALVLGATSEMLPASYLDADAFNIVVINSNTININKNNPNDRIVSAVSLYKMGNGPGPIASFALNGEQIPYMNDWEPGRYYQEWYNSGPNFNDIVVWDFKQSPTDTIVHDSLDIPPPLGNINIGSNTAFSRTGNTTINWENATVGGQVGIAIQWYVVDENETELLEQGGRFVKVVDDNGTYEISPQDLFEAEVPTDADRLNVRIYRMNSRNVVTYDNGNKKATAVALVERAFSAPIE